ncbi:sodium:calcium antiporter [Halorientalis sp. IM1011]|uniref:sodium:calcium antiporter n=1 Tax=Halorientalis sp. IM1011 TaxID=1932360 RepID=UPI00097CD368|nr:sodium:calcium antiporter [Halorientalis sp. IM1011]AQL43750.1 sodium:calcium antiporter [Halorientalis sp. IM1011]
MSTGGVSLVDIGIILVATGGIWIGSGWLEDASEELSTYYGLPQVVQGAIVTAVGSSFPELASVVFAAILTGSIELGVGAIVGSAIFNILVIPALSGIAVEDDIEANRTLVYKEAQFYMLAVSVLVITFALAVIYYPDNSAGAPDLAGFVTRPLALIPIGLYGLYIFIQAQDTGDYEADTDGIEAIDVRREWGYLAAGLVVILIAVERLVHSVDVIGATLGVPEFIMGVTIIAAATSLPDALVSVRAAQEDRGVASLANVLGSNTFDLLVAIPVGVLIVGSASIDFAMAVPMFAVLTLATIHLFTVLRTDLSLTDLEAYSLLLAYLVFVVWVVLESAGVIDGILPAG